MINREEGPSFLTRLWGRVAHPPSHDRCSSCGGTGADLASKQALASAGLGKVAPWAELCPSCRRQQLERRLAGEFEK